MKQMLSRLLSLFVVMFTMCLPSLATSSTYYSKTIANAVGEGKVYATYMSPSQIKIGKVCSYNKTDENVGAAVALAENGEIILDCL